MCGREGGRSRRVLWRESVLLKSRNSCSDQITRTVSILCKQENTVASNGATEEGRVRRARTACVRVGGEVGRSPALGPALCFYSIGSPHTRGREWGPGSLRPCNKRLHGEGDEPVRQGHRPVVYTCGARTLESRRGLGGGTRIRTYVTTPGPGALRRLSLRLSPSLRWKHNGQ